MNDNELIKKCRDTVDAWDQETLIDYAVTSLFSYYYQNSEEIEELI